MRLHGKVSSSGSDSTRSASLNRLGAIAVLAVAASAFAQPPMEPVGATLRYEVALPGSTWGSSVTIQPGERVEWRAVVSYTGTEPAVALGQVFYQPVLSNVDHEGAETTRDNLGAWRYLTQPGVPHRDRLEASEGETTQTLLDYGRVVYTFTSRSTSAGSSGAITGHRHTSGGLPAPGGFFRIAGSNNPTWYPASIPNGSVDLNNQILWGVVSDNNSAASTWFVTGTQNLTIFRQAFIASTDAPLFGERVVTINSESATLRRAGGGAGTDDTRFMTWARQGEGGSTATIRVGVEYIPATITIVPGPGVAVPLLAAAWWPLRRKRR